MAEFRRSPLPALPPSPLQQAFENYSQMESDLADTKRKNTELSASNAALLAEANMLREAIERADGDRIRLQAICSTLLGRLLSINDVIGGAVKESIKYGIEAVEASKPEERDELNRAGSEVREIIERTRPAELPPNRFGQR